MIRTICTSCFYLALLLMFALSMSEPAEAASYLKCLEESRGKLIAWDTRWSADRQDNGVLYSVTNVEIVNRIPDRIVTLQLQAKGRAEKSSRNLSVQTEEKARTVCKSFTVERRELSLPGEARRQSSEYTLPFIRYTKDGWVRALRPTRAFDFAVCRVHQREFSCLNDEKERFGIMLKTVEEEIRWSGT